MAKRKDYYVDDFLEGSYIYYSKIQLIKQPYLIYPRLYGFQRIGPKYYNEMEYWNEYTIIYTISGSGILTIDNQSYTLKPYDLVFVENNSYHSLKPIHGSGWNIYFTHLYQNQIVSEIYQRLNANYGPVISNIREDLIVPYILKLCEFHKNWNSSTPYQMSYTIYEMLVRVLEYALKKNPSKINSKIISVINYINDNYTSSICLNDILDKCNYSRTHLERIFKEATKTTIKDYIIQLRLALAKELITSTTKTFEEIAATIGLNEYRSLHYLFIKYEKMTPSEYRRKKNKAIAKKNSSNSVL